MGWTFGHSTKQGLIKHLTMAQAGETRTWDCVAHCYRGNSYRGVLWTVQTVTVNATHEIVSTFIGCYLLSYNRSQGTTYCWGYKDMCESMHPYYYSCPLGYLEMAPEECPEWRAKVRAYHAKRTKKLVVGETYLATSGLHVGSRKIKAIKVVSLKPLRGDAIFEDSGCPEQVKFSKKHVGDAVA